MYAWVYKKKKFACCHGWDGAGSEALHAKVIDETICP
jgi:hypothetical protein